MDKQNSIMTNNLKGLIKMRKLTVDQVAEHLGLTTKTMYNKLAGHSKITLLEAKALADLFHTTIEDIFFSDEIPKMGKMNKNLLI